jgi:hypothetical protein
VLLQEAIATGDRGFGEDRSFVCDSLGQRLPHESLWYAGALLVAAEDRGANRGDPNVIRAAKILDALLDTLDGITGAERSFVATELGIVLQRFRQYLGLKRSEQIEECLHRLVPSQRASREASVWSAEAIWYAWLDAEFGYRLAGELAASRIAEACDTQPTLLGEHAPAFHAARFWGLGLWRRSSSNVLRDASEHLSAALWRDLTELFHPGLYALCGPFDVTPPGLQPLAASLTAWLRCASPSVSIESAVTPQAVTYGLAMALPVLVGCSETTKAVEAGANHKRYVRRERPYGGAFAACFEPNLMIGVDERDAVTAGRDNAVAAEIIWRHGVEVASLEIQRPATGVVRAHRRLIELTDVTAASLVATNLGAERVRIDQSTCVLPGLRLRFERLTSIQASRYGSALLLQVNPGMSVARLLVQHLHEGAPPQLKMSSSA